MRVLPLLSLLVASVCAFVPTPAFSRAASSLAVAVDTSDIKNGMTLEIDGEPHKVLSFSIMKQARGAAKTTIKFKNLVRPCFGASESHTFYSVNTKLVVAHTFSHI
jgi:elongation factor P